MIDNIFNSVVFALIVAVSIGAASAIVQAERDLERPSAQAVAAPASPEIVELPPVTVIGHRRPGESRDFVALSASGIRVN